MKTFFKEKANCLLSLILIGELVEWVICIYTHEMFDEGVFIAILVTIYCTYKKNIKQKAGPLIIPVCLMVVLILKHFIPFLQSYAFSMAIWGMTWLALFYIFYREKEELKNKEKLLILVIFIMSLSMLIKFPELIVSYLALLAIVVLAER